MSLWSRLVDCVAGWFRRAPAPGRFESGSAFSFRGFVTTAPMVWPSRDYLVYVPRGHTRWKRAPLLVLCHGCKQTAEDLAQSARIAELADRDGFVVLLPQQKDPANPWRCWNWFERRTTAGDGEAAIVAAQIRAVRRAYRIDPRRVVAAGLSAGGALAAILGVRHPRLVRGVAVHSGLACGAARSPLTAMQVMKDGPDGDVMRLGREARAAVGAPAVRVPLVAIHGTGDAVVAPVNAVALVGQYLALNGVDTPGSDDALAPPDSDRRIEVAPGRTMRVREWRREGRLLARLVEIEGLGHAWSGGDPAQRFTEAAPPAASDLVAGLFADGLSSRS